MRRRDAPPQLESLLRQLLDKDPARRPADACQVYDLLLSFVSPPDPLGDIDPEAGNRTGMQLYPRLLARLSGADPDGPGLSGTRPAMRAPRTRSDAGWTVRHSLWPLPALLFGGLGAWVSFGYIAARHQRLPWLAAAAAYLALTVATFVLINVNPDSGSGPLPAAATIGVSLLVTLWPAAIIHSLWVNFQSRLPLLST